MQKTENTALDEIPVIIMAGGKGTRLSPYTRILPKPLIPIGEVPILERIFRRFYQFGVKEFFVTVNYKKEFIKSYFIELNPPYDIHYIEENVPLGTAGSIGLIDKTFVNPVIIANCDTLIETDYGKILEHHIKSGNSMTIVSALKSVVIPYGVLDVGSGGAISAIKEKPQKAYYINTGMYIVNPEYLSLIPQNRVFHMTDLVECLIERGERVGMYPINEEDFLDMGEFGEMEKMEECIHDRYAD